MFSMMFLAAIFMSMKTEVQHISKTYPRETLASRIHNISKDYNVNIGYRPEQCDFEIQKITLMNAGVEEALSTSLDSTLFAYRKKADNTFVVFKKEPQQQKQPVEGKGIIKGKVTDEKGEPLPGANVWIPALQTGAITDFEGNYAFSVPAGSYTIEISFISYQAQQITMVKVSESKTTSLSVKLLLATEDIEEVKVTAEYKRETVNALYAKQKKSVVLGNGISAEQITVLPDNNVGQVLKRVTGLTVQDNKFVTVRGMSERYNNVMLNGALMPSTEPNRRNFSFDIIPSNLVDNVVVAKSFSPELPAEFSGGIVQISTIDIPQKTFFNISIGTGINTNTTGKNFRTSKRYKSDYFSGGDDRTWMNTSFDVEGYFKVYDSDPYNEEYKAMSKYMDKIPNHWGLYNYTAQPTQSYSLSFGKPLTLNGHSIGVVTALTYRHEEKTEDYDAMYRDKIEYVTNNGKTYKFTTSIGALGNLAWKFKNHKIVWRNLYNRRFANTNDEFDMKNENYDGQSYSTFNEINYEYYTSALITTLWQTRLEGDHYFYNEHIKINWFADKNNLEREQPDDHYSLAAYDSTDTGRGKLFYDLNTPTPGTGGYLLSSLYNEDKINYGVNMELATTLLGHEQKLKFGFMNTEREAASQLLGLKILMYGKGNGASFGIPDYMLYNESNFTRFLYYYSVYSEQYKGDQHINAMYAMADIRPLKWLRLTGGMRYENSETEVTTRVRVLKPYLYWVDSTIVYPETDWLPSVTSIFNVNDKISIKASYSKTVTRPEFRERAAVSYYDVNEKARIAGNRGLIRSYSDNYDARIEWYPALGEILSAGIFYKKFDKPAEMVAIDVPAGGYLFFYFNIDEAMTRGLEFEVRKSLGFIAPDNKILSNIYITANATIMDGDVTYNADQLLFQAGITSDDEVSDTLVDEYRSRTLQGLSPFVMNLGINYTGKHFGGNISYNRSGNILMIGGINVEADEYERGRDVIDLQLSYKLLQGKMKLKVNVSDLLAQPYIRFRNNNPDNVLASYKEDPEGLNYNPDWDWILKKSWKGTGYSVSLSYKF